MRVAIIIWSFFPVRIGGTEVATLKIAERLVALGHEVHVVTRRDKGLRHESIQGGFHVHRIFRPNLKYLGAVIFYINALLTLKKVNPQVVLAQDFLPGLLGFFAKKVFKMPLIVWGRGYDFRSIMHVTTTVLKSADVVIALTDDMKKELQRVWQRDIIVIPNGIQTERFERISRVDARHQLGIPEGRTVILYVGRLEPIKGAAYLIEAMQYISQTEPRSRLTLVGDGSEREKLETLVNELGLSESVSFIGKIQNDSVPVHMVAADVLVLPSLSEGFPNVSLEAMAAALPIVATNVGGMSSIVEDGINGFLVEPQNASQIAEKVVFILQNHQLSRTISKNNREKAQQYKWDNIVTQLINEFELLVDPRMGTKSPLSN